MLAYLSLLGPYAQLLSLVPGLADCLLHLKQLQTHTQASAGGLAGHELHMSGWVVRAEAELRHPAEMVSAGCLSSDFSSYHLSWMPELACFSSVEHVCSDAWHTYSVASTPKHS